MVCLIFLARGVLVHPKYARLEAPRCPVKRVGCAAPGVREARRICAKRPGYARSALNMRGAPRICARSAPDADRCAYIVHLFFPREGGNIGISQRDSAILAQYRAILGHMDSAQYWDILMDLTT